MTAIQGGGTVSWPGHPADRRRCGCDQRGAGRLCVDRRDIHDAGPLASTSAPGQQGPVPPAADSGRAKPDLGAMSGKCEASAAIIAPQRRSGDKPRLSLPRASARPADKKRAGRQAATNVQVRTRAEHDRSAVLCASADVLGAGTDHVHEKRWPLTGKGAERFKIGQWTQTRRARSGRNLQQGQESRPSGRCRRVAAGFRLRLRDVDRSGMSGACRGCEDPAQEIGPCRIERVRRRHASEPRGPGAGLDKFPVFSLGTGQRVAGHASREPSNSWKKTRPDPPRPKRYRKKGIADVAHRRVPAATAARAARLAASKRCSAEKAAVSRPTCVAQETSPSPPRKRPASTDSRRACGRSPAGQQRTLRALLR